MHFPRPDARLPKYAWTSCVPSQTSIAPRLFSRKFVPRGKVPFGWVYGIRTWDPDHKGALFEPHHNTYDIEFWGAEPLCTGIYIGAIIVRVERRHAGFGADSLLAIVVFVLGMWGLAIIAS